LFPDLCLSTKLFCYQNIDTNNDRLAIIKEMIATLVAVMYFSLLSRNFARTDVMYGKLMHFLSAPACNVKKATLVPSGRF